MKANVAKAHGHWAGAVLKCSASKRSTRRATFRFTKLALQFDGDGLVAISVDKSPQLGPRPIHCRHGRDAAVVMFHEADPQRLSGPQPVFPRHVVKPKQVFVWDAARISIAMRDLRSILCNRVA